MKKGIGLILVLLMLFTVTTTFAEETINRFEPMLLNAFDYSAGKWFDKEDDRALMSVMLAAESAMYDPNLDLITLMTYDSYVLYDEEGMLTLTIIVDNGLYSVAYIPSVGMALGPSFSEKQEATKYTREFEMALLLSGNEYHKNSKTALNEAIEFINKEFYNR